VYVKEARYGGEAWKGIKNSKGREMWQWGLKCVGGVAKVRVA